MIDELDWIDSGERLVPAVTGGGVIEAEHLARYRLALPWVAGKVVLDAGCGVGWGAKLLLNVGPAAQVIGVDNFPPAIDYACATYPGPNYVVGDVAKLDLADASVDVVICFETLEHVHDHVATLAEFRRVLRPDGMLFVSSPNPTVYPAGNPFHVHEVEPGELRESVSAQFPHTILLRQELLIGSLVAAPGVGLEAAELVRIGASDGATDQYGIVVASAGPLPTLDPTLILAPSDQLTRLDEIGRALVAERAAFATEATAVAAEQDRLRTIAESATAHAVELVSHIEALNAQLVAAGAALRSVMDERDELAQRIAGSQHGADLATEELTRERAANRQGSERQRAELERLRRDRDHLLAESLHDEQALARGELPASISDASPRPDVAELARSARALADELNAIRASRSWRVTAPLRRMRDIQLRVVRLDLHRDRAGNQRQ